MPVVFVDDVVEFFGIDRRLHGLAEDALPGAEPLDMVGLQVPVIGHLAGGG